MAEKDKKTYTYDEVYKATLAYFEGDELAASTWMKKYCLTDNDGNFLELTPDDMHRRMAKEFARIEESYEFKMNHDDKLKMSPYGYNRVPLNEESIYELFKNFKYIIPGGSIMSTLGSGTLNSLSNCTVIASPSDDVNSIMNTAKDMANLYKRRNGVGVDISTLRPRDSIVNNTAKTSSGAASFMDLYSVITTTISQNSRRGALMITLSIEHPDALEFIEKKQDLTKVTGANISIRVTDEFMQAVRDDEDFIQTFPVGISKDEMSCMDQSKYNYGELYKTDFGYAKKVKAREVWNTLIHCAWNTAEPGIIFDGTMHNYAPDGVYPDFKMISTNPCSEIGMGAYESCRLIHLNLLSYIDNPFTPEAKLNEKLLFVHAYECARLGDDIVDLEVEFIDKMIEKFIKEDNKDEYNLWMNFRRMGLEARRIGVGFTGLSDAIAMLNLKYDSDEALAMIDKIMRIKLMGELTSSIDMAIERGTFKGYNKDLEWNGNNEGNNLWYQTLSAEFPKLAKMMQLYGRRNISFSTAAPVGTASLLARCSSGIEPLFMPFYVRRRKCMNASDRVDFVDVVGEKYTEFIVVHPTLKKWAMMKSNLTLDEVEKWDIDKWNEIYKDSPWFGSTAPEIDWVKRVEIQGIAQKYISHSISSTINLPKEATEEEIATIYYKAWERKLKGITVYRDQCRNGILVSADSKKEEKEKKKNLMCIDNSQVTKRPKSIPCKIFRFSNKGEKWVGVIGLVDNKPYEIFTGLLDKLDIPNWVVEGFVVRNKEKVIIDGEEVMKSRYDICYEDKNGNTICVEGLSRIFRPEYWNYAKLISGLLRHHMPITYVIKVISSLNLDDSTINTWKNGVIRLLRKFIDSVESEEGYEKCPECGGRIIRQNGCLYCTSCGLTKCE